MPAFGQAALLVSLIVSVWVLFAASLGALTRSPGLVRSASRGTLATAVLVSLSTGVLLLALLTDRFEIRYVAEYSSREQPMIYKLSALWGGQDGSLLLWCFLLSLFSAIVVLTAKKAPQDLLPWVYASLAGVLVFFITITAFVANPFRVFGPMEIPANGQGLNPLLQNPWMVIHPPTLYFGYVGATIPLAFALAALFANRLDNAWVRATRRWTLFTFGFLSIGIWLGAYWAYLELGWGGFWAWDPVENASFLPWLTLTAYLHSVIIQERKGMFRVWSFVLIILTQLLVVYGTFITRSGIIQSVHAFQRSNIGYWFMLFMGTGTLFAFALLLRRLPQLKAKAPLESFWSREGTFLFANIVLVGLTLMIFTLTMWPVFSELFTGQQVTKEPIQFTQATRPFFLLLLFLMGTGPIIGWKNRTGAELGRAFVAPAAAGIVTAVACLIAGAREPWSLAYFAVSVFVLAAVFQQAGLDIAERRRTTREALVPAFFRQVSTHRRQYGGYLVHIGVAVMAIGIAGSSAYKLDETFEALAPGQSVELDGYRIAYEGFDIVNRPEYDAAIIRLGVQRPGSDSVEHVTPQRRVYKRTEQPTTEVAILPTLLPRGLGQLGRVGEDFYVIAVNLDVASGRGTFEVIVHPLINFLWLGGLIVAAGCLVSGWPPRREEREWIGEPAPAAA
ncbi:MAG: cytochrome c biogenesis protein CcsA [Acidobacteria bacterium]|jgi:cytochrome c-type biogenesis protein CcmF|nr:cytochrome c biogenesis protein CcsA [Acidobacteriota bacterium]